MIYYFQLGFYLFVNTMQNFNMNRTWILWTALVLSAAATIPLFAQTETTETSTPTAESRPEMKQENFQQRKDAMLENRDATQALHTQRKAALDELNKWYDEALKAATTQEELKNVRTQYVEKMKALETDYRTKAETMRKENMTEKKEMKPENRPEKKEMMKSKSQGMKNSLEGKIKQFISKMNVEQLKKMLERVEAQIALLGADSNKTRMFEMIKQKINDRITELEGSNTETDLENILNGLMSETQ